MSASRIGGAEGMDVDDTEVALPTNEWMEAAQRAADTDGILENGPAKRQKVCNPCSTLTALHLHKPCTRMHTKRESLSREYACESHDRPAALLSTNCKAIAKRFDASG